jgi:hypothetical protein
MRRSHPHKYSASLAFKIKRDRRNPFLNNLHIGWTIETTEWISLRHSSYLSWLRRNSFIPFF